MLGECARDERLAASRRHARQVESPAIDEVSERRHAARACRAHPGRAAHALEHRDQELFGPIRLAVLLGDGDVGHQDVGRVVARVHIEERHQASGEEGGADEQDDGEGALDDQQTATQATAGRTCGPRSPGLHRRRQRDAGVSQRGQCAGCRADEDRGDQRGDQEPDIHPDIADARKAGGGKSRHRDGHDPSGAEPECTAQQRDHQALGQELPREATPTGAERGTDGELARPPALSGEQQVRNVGARDQEHQADTDGEHHQRGTHGHRHLVDQRTDTDLDRPTLAKHQFGKGPVNRSGVGRPLRFSLRRRRSGRQARDGRDHAYKRRPMAGAARRRSTRDGVTRVPRARRATPAPVTELSRTR